MDDKEAGRKGRIELGENLNESEPLSPDEIEAMREWLDWGKRIFKEQSSEGKRIARLLVTIDTLADSCKNSREMLDTAEARVAFLEMTIESALKSIGLACVDNNSYLTIAEDELSFAIKTKKSSGDMLGNLMSPEDIRKTLMKAFGKRIIK